MSEADQSSGYKQTSLEAWESSKETSYEIKRLILELLSELEDGATDEELERIMGTERSRSSRPARYALRNEGLVRNSGKRRPTESGKSAIVWEITPEDEVGEQKSLLAPSAVRSRINKKLKKLNLVELTTLERVLDGLIAEKEKQ